MNIARLRQEAGLRQVDLARAMGVDRSTIAKWESGLSAPKSGVLLLTFKGGHIATD